MKYINVIMPSYLGIYENAAKNRDVKFIRAIESFLNQTYVHKRLIIVSDGCELTNKLYKRYENIDSIKLIQLTKQPLFSGNVRQSGINEVPLGEIICYLDTDDELLKHHLNAIMTQISDNEFVYYDDQVYHTPRYITTRTTGLRGGGIGTSSIAHINKEDFNWIDCNEYGHDWKFISNKLLKFSKKHNKIKGCGYLVHHIPKQVDS